MHLLLRRSQRDIGILWTSTLFVLDARLELSPEERHTADKYKVLRRVVFDSNARIANAEAAYENFDQAAKVPMLNPTAATLAASLWANLGGVTRSMMMALALRVTFASLVAGQHIESKDLDQIIAAELAITEACERLALHLETALTFDDREDLREY